MAAQYEAFASGLRKDVTAGLLQIQDQVEKLKQNLEQSKADLVAVLNRKAYKSEVSTSLSRKADFQSVKELSARLDDKLAINDFRESVSNLHAERANWTSEMDRVLSRLRQKLDSSDVRELIKNYQSDQVSRALESRPSTEEVRVLVRGMMKQSAAVRTKRSQASEVGHLKLEHCQAHQVQGEELASLAAKVQQLSMAHEASQRSMSKWVAKGTQDVKQLSRTVMTSLSVGRWLWRSGARDRGGWVPWDVQAINAAPDFMCWSGPGSSAITLKIPGLYRMELGFFTSGAFSVQVCVGGEPLLSLHPSSSACSSSSVRCHHHRHSSGNVASHGIVEFLTLPSDSGNGAGPGSDPLTLRCRYPLYRLFLLLTSTFSQYWQ
ncbi:unnamed protein product [Chrysoparadoxa australica]